MVAYSAGYRDGKRIARDVTVEGAAQLAGQGDGFVWLALRDPDREELESVARAFDLAMAVVESGAGPKRPRLQGYKGHRVLTLRPARYDEAAARIDLGEIRVILGQAYVISVFRGGPADPGGARERLEDLHPALLATGPGSVVWAILD